MDNMIRIDKDYVEWLKHVKKRFKNTQIKASIKVNDELLRFYWSIGKDIVNMQAESKWGGAFFETLSEDLKKMFPGAKGFSTTNLRYMKRYYNLFGEILPQLGAELPEATNLPQVGAEIYALSLIHIFPRSYPRDTSGTVSHTFPFPFQGSAHPYPMDSYPPA